MAPASKPERLGFAISDDTGNQVLVRKVNTRKGERLEIASPRLGASSRLDAVALESITWQKSNVFDELLSVPNIPEDDEETPPPIQEVDDELRIANEFAEVFVSKASLDDGDELELQSRRLHYSIRLDVSDLEILSCQDSKLYSEFLVYPFGPDT